jgi:signal transduction histidine kinase/ActR/RegA family two-component response regulator
MSQAESYIEPSRIQARPVHAVQFYEREEFLVEVVGDYLSEGASAGDPLVVIATEAHRRAFTDRLTLLGDDVDALCRDGQLILLDAALTLASFMNGAAPDARLFAAHIGDVIGRAAALRPGAHVRAYGEMVDLLWRDGRPDAAIRLEELWNDLANKYTFSLLCAYPMGNFYKEAHGQHFEHICRTHSRVRPAEVPDDVDARAREIASLQQRAEALNAEVEQRKELEKALRDALAERRREEQRREFLLDATMLLNRSLDYEARLGEVADLAVPRLADWCAVDVPDTDGGLRRVAEAPCPRELGRGEQPLVLPMKVGDRMVGTLTLFRDDGDYDVELAAELARRAAVALDNALLYRLAQHANRTKDEFLATLSHELRTPLTAILGWARLITIGGLDAETMRTAVETIERSAQTQATIIDDLLDLSRVVTGKLTLQSELVDVGAVAGNAVQTLRLAAEAKGIHLDVSIPAGRTIVTGDSTRLQQIAWNLLSNAIKFSETGGSVSLSLQRGRDHARVVVSDNGRGIAPEFLPHVFEAFRQADGASTRLYGGLGLGLAIVKYLTELHGGTVTAVSGGIGRGAAFTVSLPLALRRSAAVPAVEDTAPELHNLSVLVVEDDADTRKLVAAMLRLRGADVTTVASAEEARAALRHALPDVIVTDIAMPEQDGFALLRSLRDGDEAVRRIPAVAVTAFGDAKMEAQLREAGFNAYVRKPIDPLQFVRVICEVRGENQ